MAEGGMLSRRALVAGGAALAVLGTALALRPADRGGAHDDYFIKLQAALREAGIAHPVLVVDKARLARNIALVHGWMAARRMPLRIVAKSLPSADLLRMIMQGSQSERLMLFSAQMARHVLDAFGPVDMLMGKPVPTIEIVNFAQQAGPDALSHIQWLVDSPARVAELGALATAQRLTLRLNCEIDVGLHRGGFAQPEALSDALKLAAGNPLLSVSGLMGYDPHVAKMPDPKAAHAEALGHYRAMLKRFDAAAPTLNAAGSPTFRNHLTETVANELSVGSAFVKPGDFDYTDLAELQPAAFIATPVLKVPGTFRLPGYDWLSTGIRSWDRNAARAFFVHGGHWLAKPISPTGLQNSSLYGRSSNQELFTGSAKVMLHPGDTVFLRPDQSEALFLQFSDLLVYENGSITARWATFPVSA